MSNDLKWHTEQRKISELIPFEHNPRILTDKQFSELKKSLIKFDLVEIPAIDLDKKIIAGHQRLRIMAALGRGEEMVDVRVPSRKLTPDEFLEYNLRSNKNTGEWDVDILANFDEDLLKDVGFDSKELDRIFQLDTGYSNWIQDIPTLRAETTTATGDVFILGDHRLMCGDSGNPDHIAKLMGNEKADMVFTDPPYGVSIGAKNRFLNSFQKAGRNLSDIKDDYLPPEELYSVLLTAFSNLKSAIADCCSLFVCAPQGGSLGMMMMTMMKDAGFEVRHVLIWKKNAPTFSMGRLDYDYQHEPILLAWNKSHKFYGGGQHKTSVWEIDKPISSKAHPTMKPVELVENAILNNSAREQIVIDIFGGSGTTLIACEKTNRKCRTMEIDPHYCDVIVERWEKVTGQKAIKQ